MPLDVALKEIVDQLEMTQSASVEPIDEMVAHNALPENTADIPNSRPDQPMIRRWIASEEN